MMGIKSAISERNLVWHHFMKKTHILWFTKSLLSIYSKYICTWFHTGYIYPSCISVWGWWLSRFLTFNKKWMGKIQWICNAPQLHESKCMQKANWVLYMYVYIYGTFVRKKTKNKKCSKYHFHESETKLGIWEYLRKTEKTVPSVLQDHFKELGQISGIHGREEYLKKA